MRAMNCFTEGIMVVNSASADFNILFLNMAWTRITGGFHAGLGSSWMARPDLHFKRRCGEGGRNWQAFVGHI